MAVPSAIHWNTFSNAVAGDPLGPGEYKTFVLVQSNMTVMDINARLTHKFHPDKEDNHEHNNPKQILRESLVQEIPKPSPKNNDGRHCSHQQGSLGTHYADF